MPLNNIGNFGKFYNTVPMELLPVLFITALAQESAPLREMKPMNRRENRYRYRWYSSESADIHLLESGPGDRINPETLHLNIQEINPSLIIHYGICGTLDPAIPLYSQFRIGRVRDTAGNEIPLRRPEWLSPHCFRKGSLLTVDQPVLSEKSRDLLYRETTASLVDMEGFLFASFAESLNIPLLMLKLVTDTADEMAVAVVSSNMKIWQNHLKHMLKIISAELSSARKWSL